MNVDHSINIGRVLQGGLFTSNFLADAVQVSTKFLTPQGWNAAEALTYVPDTMIVGEKEGDGHYLVHKHQQTEDGDA